MSADTSVILVAAGSAARMGGMDKTALPLHGIPVLARAALAFEACADVAEIIVVTRAGKEDSVRALLKPHPITKLSHVVAGGSSRTESAMQGFAACRRDTALIAIHDGARPLVTPELAARVIADARKHGAAIPSVPVRDTIKAAEGRFVSSTPDRDTLFAVQTPQVFRRELYQTALEAALRDGASPTDDAQLVERIGVPVYLSEGDAQNGKLTAPEDLPALRAWLGKEPSMRIGHGYDVHRLVPDRALILGGVTIPYEYGLLGHSDADVLAHAVTDALLGAAALGDIGAHFPDTDERYKDADSILLLQDAAVLVRAAGYAPVNMDATLLAQKPKLAPYLPAIRERLAQALELPLSSVSVKATTEEGLGFTGTGEGMAAHAVCLLECL